MAVWRADTTHFTADDSLYHTADGWHLDDLTVMWTADTTHFTVDDNLYHTADGWHDDVAAGLTNQRGGWYGFQNQQAFAARLRDDEQVILSVIKTFLEEAA